MNIGKRLLGVGLAVLASIPVVVLAGDYAVGQIFRSFEYCVVTPESQAINGVPVGVSLLRTESDDCSRCDQIEERSFYVLLPDRRHLLGRMPCR
jgi:hypothetical protein